MPNEVLVSYIKKQLDKNISQERVRQALVAAKWREQDIVEAFDAINKASAPAPVVKPVEPVVPKVEPVAPKVEPIVPKVEPVKPVQPEPPIQKPQPVMPPVQPVAPKPAPVAPPKVEPIVPKVEPKPEPPKPVPPPVMPKPQPVVPPVQPVMPKPAQPQLEVTTSDLNYEPEKSSSGIGKMIVLVVVIILIAVGIYFGFNAMQANNLKKIEQAMPPVVSTEETTKPAPLKTDAPQDENIKRIASAILLGGAVEAYNDTKGTFPASFDQLNQSEVGSISKTGITYKQLEAGKGYELCVDLGTSGIKCAYSDPAKNESPNSLVSYMQTMSSSDSAKIMQYLIPSESLKEGLVDTTAQAKDAVIIALISKLSVQAELANSNDGTYIKFAGKACRTYSQETIAICTDLAKEVGGTFADMQKYIVGTLDGKGYCIKVPLTIKYQDKQDYYCLDSTGVMGKTNNTNVCTLKDQTCGITR